MRLGGLLKMPHEVFMHAVKEAVAERGGELISRQAGGVAHVAGVYIINLLNDLHSLQRRVEELEMKVASV